MKIGSLCYIRNPSDTGFLTSLQLFRPSFPLLLYTDAPITESIGSRYSVGGYSLQWIPPILKLDCGSLRSSNVFANQAFIHALVMASIYGWNYFIYLEDDCAFGRDHWDAYMIEEFVRNRKLPESFAGFPVFWNIMQAGGVYYHRAIQMAYQMQTLTGFPVELRSYPDMSPAMYPNGALAIYPVRTTLEIFAPATSLVSKEPDAEKWTHYIKRMQAFDLFLGQALVRRYTCTQLFDSFVPLSCIYSGCGDELVSQSERLQALKDRRLVAVHSIKKYGGEL